MPTDPTNCLGYDLLKVWAYCRERNSEVRKIANGLFRRLEAYQAAKRGLFRPTSEGELPLVTKELARDICEKYDELLAHYKYYGKYFPENVFIRYYGVGADTNCRSVVDYLIVQLQAQDSTSVEWMKKHFREEPGYTPKVANIHEIGDDECPYPFHTREEVDIEEAKRVKEKLGKLCQKHLYEPYYKDIKKDIDNVLERKQQESTDPQKTTQSQTENCKMPADVQCIQCDIIWEQEVTPPDKLNFTNIKNSIEYVAARLGLTTYWRLQPEEFYFINDFLENVRAYQDAKQELFELDSNGNLPVVTKELVLDICEKYDKLNKFYEKNKEILHFGNGVTLPPPLSTVSSRELLHLLIEKLQKQDERSITFFRDYFRQCPTPEKADIRDFGDVYRAQRYLDPVELGYSRYGECDYKNPNPYPFYDERECAPREVPEDEQRYITTLQSNFETELQAEADNFEKQKQQGKTSSELFDVPDAERVKFRQKAIDFFFTENGQTGSRAPLTQEQQITETKVPKRIEQGCVNTQKVVQAQKGTSKNAIGGVDKKKIALPQIRNACPHVSARDRNQLQMKRFWVRAGVRTKEDRDEVIVKWLVDMLRKGKTLSKPSITRPQMTGTTRFFAASK